MGKRKRTKIPPKIWSEDQKIALICWLDYTLDHPEIDFKQMIVARLDNEYTFEQIDAKAKRLWKTKGPYPEKGKNGPEDVYKFGSRCLELLTDAEKAAIATLRETIDIGLSAEESLLTTPNRQLRSASKAESCATIQNSRLATPKAGNGRLPKNGWLKVPTIPPTTEKCLGKNETGGQSAKKRLKTYARHVSNQSSRPPSVLIACSELMQRRKKHSVLPRQRECSLISKKENNLDPLPPSMIAQTKNRTMCKTLRTRAQE